MKYTVKHQTFVYPSEIEGFNEQCDVCINHEIAFQNTGSRKTMALIIGNLKRHCESGKHRKYKPYKRR